jgi:hypothetical protein
VYTDLNKKSVQHLHTQHVAVNKVTKDVAKHLLVESLSQIEATSGASCWERLSQKQKHHVWTVGWKSHGLRLSHSPQIPPQSIPATALQAASGEVRHLAADVGK